MSRKSARPSSRRPAGAGLILLALAAIVFTVFLPTLRSGFTYDSQGEIVMWAWLHDARNILTAVSFHIMTLDLLDFNRPVAVAWLMYNVMLFGPDPFGYHLTSVLLHVAVAGLVFLFIRHILVLARPQNDPARHDAPAFLATLLFALHPLVTEAVCEPANCKDSLAALFGLGAVLLAARHRLGFGPGDPARLLLVPFLCLLSIGSKEVGVAFPFLLGLYWLLFRRAERDWYWPGVTVGSGLVTVLFLAARFVYAHVPSEVFVHPPVYPGGTLLNTVFSVQPRIFALYLVNLVCPLWLCADYTSYSARWLPLGLSWPLILLVAAGLGWIAVKDRRAGLAVALIVGALLPVANLVPLFRPAADRFLYVPLIGVALLVALALDSNWLRETRLRRRLGVGALLLILGLLFPVTLQREQVWSSALCLWQDTLAKNPQSVSALVGLPEALQSAERWPEAKAASEKAIRTPAANWPWIWFDYAVELEKLGDHAGAERAARRAIELKPDIADRPKMVRTLQQSDEMMQAFAPIAARLSTHR
jgi:hypothetical protein